ncbi:MAG: plasmid mobilization protein [Acidimicrobiales bacterium]
MPSAESPSSKPGWVLGLGTLSWAEGGVVDADVFDGAGVPGAETSRAAARPARLRRVLGGRQYRVIETTSGSLRWARRARPAAAKTEMPVKVPGAVPSRAPAHPRSRRTLAGHQHQVIVSLTGGEHAALQQLAATAGVSMSRYLLRAGLSGSACESRVRRLEARELKAARVVLKGLATTLEETATWANANHELPGHFADLVDNVARVVSDVEQIVTGRGPGLPNG